jgi:hypothetical protein
MGWFAPDGSFSYWVYKYPPGNAGHWIYRIARDGSLTKHDLSAISLPGHWSRTGPNRPVFYAEADESGGWLIWFDSKIIQPFTVKSFGDRNGVPAPPRGLQKLLNGRDFLRRFCDLSLHGDGKVRDGVFRLKRGLDGRLYCMDRNGFLYRIEETGMLTRLSGGAMQRLLGNAPTKFPWLTTYGPWAGSRIAFAIGANGEGRVFDPYSGCLFSLGRDGILTPETLYKQKYDQAVIAFTTYQMPSRLQLPLDNTLPLWQSWDSPSSAIDGEGNFFLLLDSLLMFPPPENRKLR